MKLLLHLCWIIPLTFVIGALCGYGYALWVIG